MKKIAIVLILSLLAGPAMAQTWQCFAGNVACAPGSPNCTCTQVVQQPAFVNTPTVTLAPAVVPTCPIMTYWNGITCQIPATAAIPAVDPSYYVLQQQLLQQQRMQEWHEQWHAQHPGGGPGGH